MDKKERHILVLDGRTLSWPDVVGVARSGREVRLAQAARQRMLRSRAVVERHLQAGDTVYGVTTGFGKFASIRIAPAHARELQLNLIRSHAGRHSCNRRLPRSPR